MYNVSLTLVCTCLLLEQAVLDVLQHVDQPLLHLSFWNCQLCARVSPHCNTLTLLHIFRTHFQADRNTLDDTQTNNFIVNAFSFSFTTHYWPLLLSQYFFHLCFQVKHFTNHHDHFCHHHIISDLEFPVVELPARGVVVSKVSLHPDASIQQPALVFGALDQQCLLLLLWQGGSDSTWDDDNLEEQREIWITLSSSFFLSFFN